MRLLFITWDGPQVSYLESLFLPIFRALQPHGIHTDVLQFRWGDADLTEAAALLCQANGIGYRAVPVLHRLGGAGAVATALAGGWHVRQVKSHFGSNILMPRSLMPALSVLVAGPRRAPILFDADGLAADERVDFAGLAKTSVTYRVLRRIEVAIARAATAVIVRSPAAADILARRADVDRSRFHVVTNGRDEDIFTPSSASERSATRKVLGIPETAPLMVYAGSVGPQYRFDAMAATALAVRVSRPDARLLVLTGFPPKPSRNSARRTPQSSRWRLFFALHTKPCPPIWRPAMSGSHSAPVASRRKPLRRSRSANICFAVCRSSAPRRSATPLPLTPPEYFSTTERVPRPPPLG